MSVIIQLTFPGGQYHATPWGRHVNEGVPEWPPSPWRLLRALVAVWKRTCADIPEEQVKRILTALADPPRFHLPPHSVAHTRHAMPMNVLPRSYKPSDAERKAGKFQGDPSIVFDTFVVVGRRDPLFIGWPDAELSAADRAALARLLANLSSLGRAEGWVHAELTDQRPTWNCGLADETDASPIPVLCPDPATALGDEHYPTLDPRKLARGKVSPADFLFDCPRWHLCLDTETIHGKRWPTVPGARWVHYTRPREVARASAKPRPAARPKPTVARFLLDGPVLPLVTDTLPVAEAFRRALIGRLGCRSEVLSGKDADGRILREHRHAFYLPTAEGADPGRLTHVTVAAADGLGADEVGALNALRRVWIDDQLPDLRVQLVGLGCPDDFRAPVLAEAHVWTSATPFVVTRYPKLRGTKRDRPEDYASPQDFARHVLRQELQRRPDLPPLALVEEQEGIGPKRLRSIQFKRFRNKPGDDGGRRPAGGFRITFTTPIRGPLCLGHSCHFGLGLFLPESLASLRAEG